MTNPPYLFIVACHYMVFFDLFEKQKVSVDADYSCGCHADVSHRKSSVSIYFITRNLHDVYYFYILWNIDLCLD
jgi:hypothetical protein